MVALLTSVAPLVGFGALALMVACEIDMARTDALLKALDDASSDGPHGDVIALPDDFEPRFHGERK